MGGPGSGRHERPDRTTCVEDVPCLDVLSLQRRGVFETAVSQTDTTVTWTRNDVLWASVGIKAQRACITLEIPISDVQQSCQGVFIDWTRCHYGRHRPWFCCPDCFRRCRMIYLNGGRFACRLCHGLPYRSQRCSDYDRLLCQVQKIRARLGVGPDVFKRLRDEHKPPGMHWTRFDRIRDRHDDYIGDLVEIWRRQLGME